MSLAGASGSSSDARSPSSAGSSPHAWADRRSAVRWRGHSSSPSSSRSTLARDDRTQWRSPPSAGRGAVRARVTALLLQTASLHPDHVGTAIIEAAGALGSWDVSALIIDLDQRVLRPLTSGTVDCDTPVEGTLAGAAFREQYVVDGGAVDGGRRVWVPVVDSAERVGVLGISVAEPVEDVVDRFRALASLCGEIVVTKSSYGDAIVRRKRSKELTLAAELRWALLPPLTFASPQIDISGILEPAYQIAGDTFDYAVNGDPRTSPSWTRWVTASLRAASQTSPCPRIATAAAPTRDLKRPSSRWIAWSPLNRRRVVRHRAICDHRTRGRCPAYAQRRASTTSAVPRPDGYRGRSMHPLLTRRPRRGPHRPRRGALDPVMWWCFTPTASPMLVIHRATSTAESASPPGSLRR